MLTQETIRLYLQRIGVERKVDPDLRGLNLLHRSHLMRVPFENLDIHLGHPIELSVDALIDKIIRRRRGGFCYELNFLFSLLLESLGFNPVLLGARVWTGGKPGRPLAHLSLLLDMDEGSEKTGRRMLADVGFGKSFPVAMPFDEVIRNGNTAFRIEEGTDEYRVQMSNDGQHWITLYDFTLAPHAIEDFHTMCAYQQTSPESVFTRQAVCSIMTDAGRKTIAGNRFIESQDQNRVENVIDSSDSLRELQKKHFGINLPEQEIDQLLTDKHAIDRLLF